MTTYSVRCRVAACRYRRVTSIHPDDYKRAPKCPKCGSKNGWRIEARDYNQRNNCTCDGPSICKGQYFPHKMTHPMCDKHPRGFYNQAKARGIDDRDIPAEYGGTRTDEGISGPAEHPTCGEGVPELAGSGADTRHQGATTESGQ